MVKLLPMLVTIGVLVDLFSCFLLVRRNKTGIGPSGLPMVTLIVFYLLPLLVTKRSVFTSSYWLDCLVLLFFHAFVVFGIPVFHRKVSKRIDR